MNWKIWSLFAIGVTILFIDTCWTVFWTLVGRDLFEEGDDEFLEMGKRRRGPKDPQA